MTKPTENVTLYAVVDREGTIYTNRDNRLCIYKTLKQAQRVADADGDSVVTVVVHLDRAPLFIRCKLVRRSDAPT